MKTKKQPKKMSASKDKAKGSSSLKKNSPQFQNYLKVLSNKRDDILQVVKQKTADISYGEIGDEADVASQTFEREMMFEMTNGERMVLDDIEAALRKIEKGDFGTCEICRKKITSERLHAMPWARYCIACQTRAEAPAGK